jgi:C-terminal processing protease CtpA/Prc
MKKLLIFHLLFARLISFSQVANTISPADKVYGLSKFWQEVNYNFVYLDKIDRNLWDNQYKELITKVQNTKNDYEYYRELQKFCALLKDGHTNIYLPKSIQLYNSMFGEYRIFVQNIDNKAIIVRTNYSKKEELPIGSEIIEVNGKETKKYVEENVAPYIASSTNYVLSDWSFNQIFNGLVGEQFTIKVKKPNNDTLELKLTHKKTEEKEVHPAFEATKPLLEFTWLNSNTAYLVLNSFANAAIDSMFFKILPELYKAKSLIIDLRKNGGGNSKFGLEIYKYFTSDKHIFLAKSETRQNISALKAWGKFTTANDTINSEWNKKNFLAYNDKLFYQIENQKEKNNVKQKKILIPIAILIGHETGSAAEDFLIYAEKQKHIIKVGEPTNGSTGMPFMFELPGGGSARVCTKKDTYPDGREFVGIGIQPDIEIKKNLEDYINKKDPVLEKAIQYLNTQKH